MTESEFLSDLTEEQRIATMKFDEDVSVTANAGSGKTTLLVRKYLYLQLFHSEKYNHKNIVAITFTNKAASEIVKKIRDTIYDLLQKESSLYKVSDKFKDYTITESQRKTLLEINKNLVNLEVGTIHKFCRKIIKNFAFRIDLQPNFTVIDENERSLLIRKIILQTLASSQPDFASYSATLVSFLGFQETIDNVNSLIFKQGYLNTQEQNYSEPYTEINEELCKEIKAINRDPFFEFLNKFQRNADLIEEATQEKIAQLKNLIEQFKINYDNKDYSFNDLSKELDIIRKFKAKTKFFSNYTEININKKLFSDYISKFVEIENLYQNPEPLLPNRVSVGYALTKVAQEVYNRYTSINVEANRLDHDSTIDYTVQLLQIKEVRKIIQHDLSYIMIDEFQDTDDRQLIIANLIRESGKVNLFVVGDDKQGIYRFRNADVRVFKGLRNELKPENRLKLRTSFRSNKYINSFVNDLFTPVMKSEISEYDVDYQEIISATNVIPQDINRINFMLYDLVGQTEDENGKVGAINQLIKSLHYLIVEKKASPKNICILSNSGNDFVDITIELDKLGLEYVLLNSKGFYSRNEVLDLVSFIQFIDDPDNDLLCAATLKSSLFCYTDQDLYDITQMSKTKETFWGNYQLYASNSSDKYHSKIADILADSIQLSNKLPISNIIIKIIDDSLWNYYYHNDKNQAKIFRNLYKFMGIVRALESMEFSGLAQTFDLLNHKIISNKDSEEAGDTSNSISISTIHSAKGLEFKHVIIFKFDLFTLAGGNSKSYNDERFGINLSIPSSLKDYKDFGTKKSIIDNYIKENGEVAAYAENLRLYYVALTRAIQSVHIILKYSENGKQFNLIKEIFGEFEPNETILANSVIEQYDIDTKKISKQSLGYEINTDYNNNLVSEFKFNVIKTNEVKSVELMDYTAEVGALDKVINFNATKLAMFERGEFKNFEEVYVFGLPLLDESAHLIDSLDDQNDTHKVTDGTQYGSLFHSIMENINNIYQNTIINQEELINVANNTALNLGYTLNSDTLERLITDTQKVLNTNYIKNNESILLNSNKEYNLKMAFGDHILNAIYDSIYINEGEVEIWDWKTNKFYGNESVIDKSKSYELQMDIYALLAFNINDSIETVNTRLLYITKIDENVDNSEWIKANSYTRKDVEKIKLKLAGLIGQIKNQYPNTYPVSPVI